MSIYSVAGIVFANVHDELLSELTAHRSMASVPFGGRYRMIDFSLSNLVNAGINNVALITKENYRSLFDHLGSGIYWDLDRKNGGLHLMPPYNFSGARRHNSYVESLYGALGFVNRSNAEYIVVCHSDMVANIDIADVIAAHRNKNADVTTVYAYGKHFGNNSDVPIISINEDGKVNDIAYDLEGEVNYGLGVTVYSKDALFNIVNQGYDQNESAMFRVIKDMLSELNVYGYEHKGFAALMEDGASYYNANMKLLNSEVRRDLFNKERPILTKTRDDMPTRYGTKANVSNSFIADGCVIDGTVKNSILFRGVRVEKGAVVENSILMQETKVGENAQIDYIISDKNAAIGSDMTVKGTSNKPFHIKKNQEL